MKAVSLIWVSHGNGLKPRSFTGVFAISKNIPASRWLDIPLAHREWCPDHSHRNRHHCDFDRKLSRTAMMRLEDIRSRVAAVANRKADSKKNKLTADS